MRITVTYRGAKLTRITQDLSLHIFIMKYLTPDSIDATRYAEQRNRNNLSVRKSREKSKQKFKETKERIVRLRKENGDLNKQVDLLGKELTFLKHLFTQLLPEVKQETLSKGTVATDHSYAETTRPKLLPKSIKQEALGDFQGTQDIFRGSQGSMSATDILSFIKLNK